LLLLFFTFYKGLCADFGELGDTFVQFSRKHQRQLRGINPTVTMLFSQNGGSGSSCLFTLSTLISLISAMYPGNNDSRNSEENAARIAYPEPTAAHLDHIYMGLGTSPRPTEAPRAELLRKRGILQDRGEHQLEARSITFTSGELIAYTAGDQTCGYISKSLGAGVEMLHRRD
jgi:hypothetical protein